MRRAHLYGIVIFWLSGVTLLFSSPEEALDPSQSDPRAIAVAERMMKSMGGKEGWEQARFFRFDFVVAREEEVLAQYRHLWDRYTGRYRVEGEDEEGTPFTVLFNTNTKQGEAYRGAERLEGEDRTKYLKMGYGRFINDTYWLLMPYKCQDPGVFLSYEGTEEAPGGERWDVVHLRFDEGVGLTPKDQYWAYVNQETGLMDKWAYVLQGRGDDRTEVSWDEWQRFGPIMLSTNKVMKEKPFSIRFEEVAVLDQVEDRFFVDPSAALPALAQP